MLDPVQVSSATLHCAGRGSYRFTDLNKAFDAARSCFPLDYIFAAGGKVQGPSQYVCDELTLRSILRLRGFGERTGDTLILWLPIGSDDN